MYELFSRQLMALVVAATRESLPVPLRSASDYSQLAADGYRPVRPKRMRDDVWELIQVGLGFGIGLCGRVSCFGWFQSLRLVVALYVRTRERNTAIELVCHDVQQSVHGAVQGSRFASQSLRLFFCYSLVSGTANVFAHLPKCTG